MAKNDSQKNSSKPKPSGTKYTISRILFAFLVISNIYLLYRVDSNNVAISNYNAGYSQRTGVGKMDSFWTKYIGGAKNLSTYEDRKRTEEDSNNAMIFLFVMDAVLVGAIYWLNKKPKVIEPQLTEEEKRRQRWERRHMR